MAKKSHIGTLDCNSNLGIYGQLDSDELSEYAAEDTYYPVADKDEIHGIKLVEKIIEKDSRYNNKLLSEISKKHNEIIIMIQRNGQVIIPNGNVRLTTGDILVINRAVN